MTDSRDDDTTTSGDAMAKPATPAKNETRQTDIRHPNGGVQTITEIVSPKETARP